MDEAVALSFIDMVGWMRLQKHVLAPITATLGAGVFAGVGYNSICEEAWVLRDRISVSIGGYWWVDERESCKYSSLCTEKGRAICNDGKKLIGEPRVLQPAHPPNSTVTSQEHNSHSTFKA